MTGSDGSAVWTDFVPGAVHNPFANVQELYIRKHDDNLI